ncbi:MAG: NADH-quinone oxidoreductase subunit L [Rhodobiaceae bacterium]|nr:NADH-quinone oxidoreductase subunit L [Rhodobiaceae bacterium]
MYQAIVFLPLLGALIAGLFGRSIGDKASRMITTGFVIISALLSWVAFFKVALGGEWVTIHIMTWIDSGALEADWTLRIDTLTAVMLVVVNSVSALVHVYSNGYMKDDPHKTRFFAYLSLFTFAMLMLVTANDLVQLFFGWEGVGLASYLLIGFWYKKPTANAAAMKAFIVNRVGDFGLILGISAIFLTVGSVEFDTIFEQGPALAQGTFNFLGYTVPLLETICMLLFMGAMGKSAQFMLHTWLPDAMEGPTPVSALIHAATMVTAGVFLVVRFSPLFEFTEFASTFVVIIGATTAFFAATIGLVQNDIKRVIAYSTCSQLGYMFVAAGIGAYEVAMFHLFTHAFFKALLFLGSGSVIHAMHHEQDMRKMGGLFKMIPLTYFMMLIGTLALTGFPFTSGYFSKGAIIEAAYAAQNPAHMYAFAMLVIAALFTSFYSWRLMFLTFHGPSRASKEVLSHVHESPSSMTIPLVLLAIGALAAGGFFFTNFVGDNFEAFWQTAVVHNPANTVMSDFRDHDKVPQWVVLSPFFMMLLGFVGAWYFYIVRPDLPKEMAETHAPLYRFLLNKWYFDEIYNVIFVKPAFWLGRLLWKVGDGRIIDGFGPNGLAARVLDVTRGLNRIQTGYVYHYAFAMLLGVAALITYFMFGGAY